jgi:hypothetical protein
MKQLLKDSNGRPIGSIVAVSAQKLEGRDGNGRLKGTYDVKEDKTRDSNGRPVGRGNLLAAVITSSLFT